MWNWREGRERTQGELTTSPQGQMSGGVWGKKGMGGFGSGPGMSGAWRPSLPFTQQESSSTAVRGPRSQGKPRPPKCERSTGREAQLGSRNIRAETSPGTIPSLTPWLSIKKSQSIPKERKGNLKRQSKRQNPTQAWRRGWTAQMGSLRQLQ